MKHSASSQVPSSPRRHPGRPALGLRDSSRPGSEVVSPPLLGAPGEFLPFISVCRRSHTHTLHCFPGFSSPPSFLPPLSPSLQSLVVCIPASHLPPAPLLDCRCAGTQRAGGRGGGIPPLWLLPRAGPRPQLSSPCHSPWCPSAGDAGLGERLPSPFVRRLGGGGRGRLGASPRVILRFAQV